MPEPSLRKEETARLLGCIQWQSDTKQQDVIKFRWKCYTKRHNHKTCKGAKQQEMAWHEDLRKVRLHANVPTCEAKSINRCCMSICHILLLILDYDCTLYCNIVHQSPDKQLNLKKMLTVFKFLEFSGRIIAPIEKHNWQSKHFKGNYNWWLKPHGELFLRSDTPSEQLSAKRRHFGWLEAWTNYH